MNEQDTDAAPLPSLPPQKNRKKWNPWLCALLVLGLVVLVAVVLPDDKPKKPRKPVAGKVVKKKKAKKKKAVQPTAVAVAQPVVQPQPVVQQPQLVVQQPQPVVQQPQPVVQQPQPVEWVPEVGVTYIFEWRTVAEAPRLFDELSDLLACKVKGLDSPQSREYFRSLVRGGKAGYLPMEAKVLEVDGTFCRLCTPGGITGWVAVEDLRRTRPYPSNQ